MQIFLEIEGSQSKEKSQDLLFLLLKCKGFVNWEWY